MNSMENKALYCFFPGVNPLEGVNIILWEKVNLKEQSFPQMLFTLEMKNFSFTIPVRTDSEQGNFKMPKFSSGSGKEMQCEILDFTKEEMEFKCLISADLEEIKDYKLLEEKLRNLKLLNNDNI